MERQENILGTKDVKKLVFSMGLPIMCSMLVQALYNIIDSIFVSQLGQNAFTAINLIFPIQNLMIGTAVGTSIGMNALLSRRLGEKQFENANKVANTGVFLGFMSGMAFAVLGLFGSRLFLKASTNIPEVIEMGTIYMQICTIFSVGLFLHITFEKILQVTGKTTYQMIAQITGALINIILDPILIFGWFFFPKLGITGAAVATIIGQWCGMTLCIFLNQKHNKEVKISLKLIRPDKDSVIKIYKVGVPSIIMQSIGSITVFGLNQILGSLCKAAINVLGSFFKLQSFIFMPVFGLTSGFIPIVGYNYGAKYKKRIMQAIKTSTIASVTIMTIGVALFWIFPDKLLGFFNPTDEILKLGIPALRIISISFIPAGVSIVFSSSFQALGNGMFSLYMSLIRQLVVIVPVAYILGQLFGVSAVWAAYPIAEFTCLIFAIIFLRILYKRKIAKL